MKQYYSKISYNPDIILSNTIESDYSGKSIKHYLKSNIKFSTELIKRAKYKGKILLNNTPARINDIMTSGDSLSIYIPEERHAPCMPYYLELDVIYEDENILIINKPAPLPCLCGPNDMGNTLQNAVYSYFNQPDKFLFRPLNRLDCGTSGLMLIAKNAYIQSYLQGKLHSDEFRREYIALVQNFSHNEKGVIEYPIARKSNTQYQVSEYGKPCKTEYRLLKRNSNISMLQIRLHSGRTHQIRVHFAYLNSPIIGDYIYGVSDERLKDRFALHSYSMDVKLPYHDKILHLEASIPDVINQIFYEN